MSYSNPRQKRTILLIEDNTDDIYFIENALQKSDRKHELHTVKDGVEALKYLRREPPYEKSRRPSLILLDLKMPKMSGLEVLKHIKEDENLRPIPVVVLTTSDADGDAAASYDLQATAFITKPKDLDAFAGVIERIEKFWLGVAQLPSSD
ncbi:MAG TPA: response regulator [Rhodothermales bacterium]|nr:response regulator [Rhodothermales bacterium]